MPLMFRCVCCGRLCDTPHDAMPYKKGKCCTECLIKYVRPAEEREQELKKRKYNV